MRRDRDGDLFFRIYKDMVTATDSIEYEVFLFEDLDEFTSTDNGDFRHT